MSRNGLLVCSFAVAQLDFSTPWTIARPRDTILGALIVSPALSVVWYVLAVLSVRRYGNNGLLALLGAPLVLIWPISLALYWFACDYAVGAGVDCT
jgi:hypothetical protein